MCRQFFRMNPYWICAHLKQVKIGHECLLKFVDNFPHESVLNLWTSKPSKNSTEFLNEMCKQFCRMNPYWICGHLKLIKIEHKSFWKLYTIFTHESLLNLWTSKTCQNSTEFLNEMCGQFCRINPYWICEHLKLVRIQPNSLMKCVDNFAAWILTEFVSIWN